MIFACTKDSGGRNSRKMPRGNPFRKNSRFSLSRLDVVSYEQSSFVDLFDDSKYLEIPEVRVPLVSLMYCTLVGGALLSDNAHQQRRLVCTYVIDFALGKLPHKLPKDYLICIAIVYADLAIQGKCLA